MKKKILILASQNGSNFEAIIKYFKNRTDLTFELLVNNKNVKAVISGHFGVNNEQHVDGVAHISTSPVPYYRIIDVMDCDTPNPTIWAELKEVK